MSASATELAPLLALCAFGYNERARQHLLALLPADLSQAVSAQLRTGDGLLTSVEGAVASELAAPWLALRAEDSPEESEGGGTRPAAAAAESAAAAELAQADDLEGTEGAQVEDAQDAHDDTQNTQVDDAQDSQIDAFFAEGDAVLEEAAAEADLPSSPLPATLVARLMIGGRVEQAAQLLGDLPLQLQGEVVVKIARSTALSVRRELSADEQEVLQALRQALPGDSENWGVQRAVEILRALEGSAALRRALGSAAELDGQVVAVVQSHLFEFDDLSRLRDTELQTLLGTCDNADLARALFEAAEPIRDRVIENVSDRRAALLSDEADLHAEATADEIELSRHQIMAQARALYERGVITTYFGSIGTEPEISAIEETQEEPESRPAAEKPAASRATAARPEHKHRQIVVAVLATGMIVVILVSLVQWLTGSTDTGEGARATASSSTAPTGGGRIAISLDGATQAPGTRTARQPQPGQSLRVPAGTTALLEFPSTDGTTTVDADPGAQIQRLPDHAGDDNAADEGAADPVASFYLRVGRVRVTVAAQRFIVRTPTAQIEATRGSVFRVRVVLDGSMQVESTVGMATVITKGRRWTLQQTQGLAVHPAFDSF